jgi:lipopolysaccharide/colanic/teichoic acid biosynthesis glycosyltransferase
VPASAVERNASAGARRLTLSRGASLCKRLIDLCGAVLLLSVSLPIILVCACIIKLQASGPVFHRRRVVGRGGSFDAFKLRSMRVDADKMLEADSALGKEFSLNFKLKDDPRVTPFGGFMRRYSLDELPQLWNVICGGMSLVGPRMISPAELHKFGNAAWIFSFMKPGLSGYWQTHAGQDLGYEQRVAMELWYAEHWSLALDLLIILKTPLRVLRGAGAD